jgi:hypothetical protein
MKNKKMKMYLSLPISGRDLNQVKDYADLVKRAWVAKGYDVVTPFEIVPEDGMPYEYCMGKDIEELMKCDGIILCDDWFSSKGCRVECHVAQVYGLKIKIDKTKYEEDKV